MICYFGGRYSLAWEVQVAYTLQEGNFAAAIMAKRGACQEADLEVWQVPPAKLHLLFHGDSTGAFSIDSSFDS